MQMLQTRQTLLNPTLLGKLEFPEPFRGLGITDSALADSSIIQASFRQDSSRIRQNQASNLRLHRPTSIPHFRMCFSPYLASKTSSIQEEMHAQTDADNHILLGPIVDAQSQVCLPNSSEFLVNQMISPANLSLHMRPRPWRSKRCREASNEFMQLRLISIELCSTKRKHTHGAPPFENFQFVPVAE